MTALHQKTLTELSGLLAKGETSSREVTEACLAQVDSVEGSVQAFITVDRDGALAQADAADQRRAQGGDLPALLGLPLGIKDNICTEGLRTTCASAMLKDFVPPYNAGVIERLSDAGAVILGKTNLDEFAMGSSTEHSAAKVTRNPWGENLIPGGSSGGSAAAVAAREVPGALGSDTGGSIRQPASHCGVVGMKPTYGRVSRYGLVAYASSLDQIGPVTRSVEDAALLLQVISGWDERDSTSANREVPDCASLLEQSLKGVKVGVPKEYFVEGLDSEVGDSVRDAIDKMGQAGAEIIEISLPHTEYAVSTYYLIATAEASSNLARYDGVHFGHRTEGAENIVDLFSRSREEGFGDEVKRRIMLGTYCLSAGYYDAYYMRALRVRTLIKRDFDEAFEKVDVIAAPTAPTAAFKIGEMVDDPLQMYLTDICTIPCNLAGIPGLSLPCGLTSNRRPIGLQLFSQAFEEPRLLGVAHQLESLLPPLLDPSS